MKQQQAEVSQAGPAIYAIATMDTKGQELVFLAKALKAEGWPVRMVDVGTQAAPTVAPDVSRERVAAWHPRGAEAALDGPDRGKAITAMGEALERYLKAEVTEGRVMAVIGLGGSGGMALLMPAMRALPVGLPKAMVSPVVAGGGLADYLGCSDVALFPSVVDLAGLNSVSRTVLGNAARAVAGMAKGWTGAEPVVGAVGLTMFGVTTPCVNRVRRGLEAEDNECIVFTGTASGGMALESLLEQGRLRGLVDVTTTEVADWVVDPRHSREPKRFEMLAERGLPCVLSLGALDMVNFGPEERMERRFRSRKLWRHNEQVTLMRTSVEESQAIAIWLSERLNAGSWSWTLLAPERGLSALDAEGQPFHDAQANEALFGELERRLRQSQSRRMVRVDAHINDEAFAEALLAAYRGACEGAAAAGGIEFENQEKQVSKQ